MAPPSAMRDLGPVGADGADAHLDARRPVGVGGDGRHGVGGTDARHGLPPGRATPVEGPDGGPIGRHAPRHGTGGPPYDPGVTNFEPFRVDVPDDGARRPPRPPPAHPLPERGRRHRLGARAPTSATCGSCVAYWIDGFDWRAQEARLNAFDAVDDDGRRPADPPDPRPLAGARRRSRCCSSTAGPARSSSSSTSSAR